MKQEIAGIDVTVMDLWKIGDTHVVIREVPAEDQEDGMYRLSRATWDLNAADSLTLKFISDEETLEDAVGAALLDRYPNQRPL